MRNSIPGLTQPLPSQHLFSEPAEWGEKDSSNSKNPIMATTKIYKDEIENKELFYKKCYKLIDKIGPVACIHGTVEQFDRSRGV